MGYTYGTNGIPIPSGKDYLVNLIDREQIAADVKEAKKVSEAIVMHLHFGDEYVRMPNNEQKELVQYVADLGVDIFFGHHPPNGLKGRKEIKRLLCIPLEFFCLGKTICNVESVGLSN